LKSRNESLSTQLEEFERKQKARYVVDPPSYQDRVGREMYERVERVTAKWKPQNPHQAHESDMNYMNVGRALRYVKSKKCFELTSTDSGTLLCHDVETCDLDEVMSSALMLYRLCCLWAGLQIEVEGPPGYKVVWTAELKHIATGEALAFSEWKGALLIRVSKLRAPPEFESDMLELLNLLCDERCPHPYDGTVAGSVA